MNTAIDDPLITRKQAGEKYFAGVSRSTLGRWVASGKLPPIIRVSRRVQGWRRSVLDQVMASLSVPVTSPNIEGAHLDK